MTVLSETPRLDLGLFEELRDSLTNRPDALPRIYETFLGNTAQAIGSLPGLDEAACVRTLHALKGSAAMVGANRLASIAAALQENVPRSPTELAAAIEALQVELTALRSVVAAQLSRADD